MELLKQTPPEHPDCEHVRAAIVRVDEAAKHMNGAITMREQTERLKEVAKKFINQVTACSDVRFFPVGRWVCLADSVAS